MISVTVVDSAGRIVPRNQNTNIDLSTDLGTFKSSDSQTVTVTMNVAGGAVEPTVNLTSNSSGTASISALGPGVSGSTTVKFKQVTQPTAMVTFNNKTVANCTETVTVDSANYTLATGTAGGYVVVVHEVFDNGTVSSPVGYSSDQSGSASSISVDLNASEAQNDGLDAITANVTLRAMLHETSSGSAYGSAISINGLTVTDDANITVSQTGDLNQTERALQIAGKDSASALTQNDVTATITRFNPWAVYSRHRYHTG